MALLHGHGNIRCIREGVCCIARREFVRALLSLSRRSSPRLWGCGVCVCFVRELVLRVVLSSKGALARTQGPETPPFPLSSPFLPRPSRKHEFSLSVFLPSSLPAPRPSLSLSPLVFAVNARSTHHPRNGRVVRRRSSLRRKRSEKMADSWTQSIVCRYFKNGTCREGVNCRYRHVQGHRNDASINEATSTHSSAYIVTCRFFKQGICKYGSQCRYRHSSGNADSNATQTNATENSASGQHTANFSRNKKAEKRTAEEWVKAPEFIPTTGSPVAGSSSIDGMSSTSGTSSGSGTSMPVSYAQAVNPSGQASSPSLEPLCPYAEATGICRSSTCTYLHGDICEFCSRAALHPHNEELRKKHTNACVKQHEADMELSFAIQRSKEKSCGVCFETIMEKSSREQRFGILPNCNHCFCLTCIRKWRQAKQFDNKIIRACPECRIPSDFVCPSMYWVDTKEEKEKLIRDYKGALSTKDCKYFNKGLGKCPFGNKCFYLHALPDGTKKDVGPPVRQRRNTADTDIDILHQLILWDFFDERDDRWMYLDLEDIPFFSDSDESDWSDYELSFD